MEKFELKDHQIEVVTKTGAKYPVKVPSFGQVKSIKKQIQEVDLEKGPLAVFEIMEKSMVELGLPQEVIDNDLNNESFLALWSMLCGGKKK